MLKLHLSHRQKCHKLRSVKLSFGSKWTNRRDDVSSSLEAENALFCSVVHCHLVDFCSNLYSGDSH